MRPWTVVQFSKKELKRTTTVMQKPTISVVIPAYNAARTLPRCIDSVLRQSWSAFEIIVVDDGGSDDLTSLQTHYGNQVTWLKQSNQGAAAARNTGVAHATGSHVAFLDADDYWEPDKLNSQCTLFIKHPSVGLCCSLCYEEKPGEPRHLAPRRIGRSPTFDQAYQPKGPDAFDTACCMTTSSIVVARDELGSAPFQLGYEPAEDRELWIRLVSRVAVYFQSQPTTTLVLEPGSLSRSKIDRDCGNMLRVVDQSREMLGRRAWRWWRARVYRRWAAEYLGNGEPGRAIRPALHRLVLQPWSLQGWWILTKASLLVKSRN